MREVIIFLVILQSSISYMNFNPVRNILVFKSRNAMPREGLSYPYQDNIHRWHQILTNTGEENTVRNTIEIVAPPVLTRDRNTGPMQHIQVCTAFNSDSNNRCGDNSPRRHLSKRQLSKGWLSKETFVQGDICPWGTFVQGSFCIRKLFDMINLHKLVFLHL